MEAHKRSRFPQCGLSPARRNQRLERKAGAGGERRESHRASCSSTPIPPTLVALPPPLSVWRPYLPGWLCEAGGLGGRREAEGRVRAGKKDDIKGGVLRRRDPVFVCSPWPDARKPGRWLPRLPFSGFLGATLSPTWWHFLCRQECYHSNGQTNQEMGLWKMPPALHTGSATRPQWVVYLSMDIESRFQDREGVGVGTCEG